MAWGKRKPPDRWEAKDSHLSGFSTLRLRRLPGFTVPVTPPLLIRYYNILLSMTLYHNYKKISIAFAKKLKKIYDGIRKSNSAVINTIFHYLSMFYVIFLLTRTIFYKHRSRTATEAAAMASADAIISIVFTSIAKRSFSRRSTNRAAFNALETGL